MGSQKMVHINPKVLKWAIEGSGWDAEELAEKINIRSELIKRWETQDEAIKVSELRKISKAIKRPLSVLLLPEQPEEKRLPDYRKMSGSNVKKISKDTLDVIRDARYVQSNARELFEMRSENARPNITPRTTKDDPETVAETERKALGLEFKKQNSKKIDELVRRTYSDLKEKIESRNILVMQAAMDIDEIRGFSLTNKDPGVILVNSRDDVRPQLFTLLHEYAHLLLNAGGTCITNSENFEDREGGQGASVERWCNNFAGAVIMPKEDFMKELNLRAEQKPGSVVNDLSKIFFATKTATVVRILNLLGNDSRKSEYMEYYREIVSEPILPKKRGGGKGDRNLVKECIDHNGTRYVRLVVDSKRRDLITIVDMIKYLDLKTKHFEKLHAQI